MLSQLLSNPFMFLLFIIGISLVVTIIISFVLPLATKKGISVDKYIKSLDAASTAADTIISIADKIMPNNSIINILKIIDCYAKRAVGSSEQLYIASKLPADQRNDKAKEMIYAALKTAGIEVTPEIDSIINGAIESEVLALGHKPIDIKQLQDINSQLQTQNIQLHEQNSALQQKIEAIQTAIA